MAFCYEDSGSCGRPLLTERDARSGAARWLGLGPPWRTSSPSSTAAASSRSTTTCPTPYRQAVFSFIEMHANSELMGGLTERDWIPKTPGLRHKMAVLAKTQDEIGHGHLLYMVAADLGVKTRAEMLEDLFAGNSRFHNVFPLPGRHLGRPGGHRLPGRRSRADQPAGGGSRTAPTVPTSASCGASSSRRGSTCAWARTA